MNTSTGSLIGIKICRIFGIRDGYEYSCSYLCPGYSIEVHVSFVYTLSICFTKYSQDLFTVIEMNNSDLKFLLVQEIPLFELNYPALINILICFLSSRIQKETFTLR